VFGEALVNIGTSTYGGARSRYPAATQVGPG